MNVQLLHPRHWPSWLGVAVLRLWILLPLPLVYGIGRIIGLAMSYLPLRRNTIIATNIALCFPELSAAEQKRLTRESLISTIYALLETAISWWSSDQRLLKRCDIEGVELLEKHKDRGILLLGLHLTTLDLAGRLFRFFHDVDVTYRQQNNAVINYQIEKYRARLFKNMIEKREMRHLIRTLKNGRTVWYAIDQNYGKTPFVFAPLFGQPAATLAMMGKISRMTDAKPLLFSHYRILNGWSVRYLLKVTDPFGEGFGDDEQKNAELLNQAYEAAIREHPEQYLWAHRRFKTRPEGLVPVYAKKRRRKKKA